MKWTACLEGGPRRVNHAAAAVGSNIYSFGGYCTGDDYRRFSTMDVHVLNTVSLRWRLLYRSDTNYDHNGEIPFQRYGHTAVAYDHRILIFGGRNDATACSDLFCFDTTNCVWSRVPTQGARPSARDGHSACIINDIMYVFGGYEEALEKFSQDLYALDLRNNVWSNVVTHGAPPSWRDFHSATAVGNRMYVFGGRGDRSGQYHSQEEFYCDQIVYLDTSNMLWVSPNTTGSLPIGRRSHAAVLYNDSLYIFGGYNSIHNKHFGDFYRFNLVTQSWSLVSTHGNGPCSRRRQACCLVANKLFLFGGTSPSPSKAMQTPLPPVDGSDPNLMDHNDLYILDFAPTLKTLSSLVVIEHSLDQAHLPTDIRNELWSMTTNNTITRPLHYNSG